MFYKLMYKRSIHKYNKSYFNILCIFVLAMTILSFTSIYNDSYLNYQDTVAKEKLTKDWICDFQVKNITYQEADLFCNVPYVTMEYMDGTLNFHVTDAEKADEAYQEARQIYHEKIRPYTTEICDEEFPNIYKYYDVDYRSRMDDYYTSIHNTRLGIFVLQIIVSVPSTMAMILIYQNYIKERTNDIRTLSGIGISDRQLNRLFFYEYNILYIISAILGIVLGAGIAYIYFIACQFVDLSESSAIYPVFDIDMYSLIMIVLLGYIIVYVAFSLCIKNILSIDASYTCIETAINCDLDKSRDIYHKIGHQFDKFFISILRKRSSVQYTANLILVIYSMSVAIFMLNAVNYEITSGIIKSGLSPSTIAESIANASLYIMLCLFSILFSLVIVWIFNKRHTESYTNTLPILYSIGADERIIYSCFYHHSLSNLIASLVLGYGVGYAITIFIFDAGKYTFNINIPYIVCNLLIGVMYYIVNHLSIKKYFHLNCRDLITL